MSFWALPADGTQPNHSFRVSLDGVVFEVHLRWNQRSATWQMTLYSAAGDVVLGSRRLLPGWSLIGRLRGRAGLPAGDLVPYDTTGSNVPPAQEDLGSRVWLVYIDAEEFE
jgi:hypothetical protein